MTQDRLQRAKERFAACMEEMRAQHERMREDLRFSNPSNPEQWTAEAKTLRAGRPTMTFDNTNKFIRQVVNDGRASEPSIQTVPADGFAHAKAAEALNGRIRHIEYASRARLAYDMSLEHSARCGLGWIRIIPKVLNSETNQQEPTILRVFDPLSCLLGEWTEPDGSDAEYGFAITTMKRKAFQAAYPKALATHGWSDEGRLWTQADDVVIAEYFEFETKTVNKILIQTPDGEQIAMTEDEYWETARAIGFKPEVINNIEVEERTQTWTKMTGCEELESTEFPSKYIPIVPVIGNELWVDGERYLSGLTRQLMDGQRMHNAEMSAYTESVMSQPKAPFMAAMEAIEGHETAWSKLSTGNPAFLPYNGLDADGRPIAPPSRVAPPALPTAFANGAMMAVNEMEAAVGMYKSSFGQPSNAVSGVAKLSDRRESNTATFHYSDNRAISLQQVGRILIDMDRKLTDTARTVRTMGEDGKAGQIRFDPDLPDAVAMKGQEVTAINPRIGEYDLRVKVGPSYLTQNEETATELAEIFRGAPQLLPALGPLWVQMKGIPNAELTKRLLIALAPPEIQQVYAEEDKDPIPAAAKAALAQKDQQIQQLSQALEKASEAAEGKDIERERLRLEREQAEAEIVTNGYRAVTDRLKVTPPMTPEQIHQLVASTVAEALAVPPVEPDDGDEMDPQPGIGGGMGAIPTQPPTEQVAPEPSEPIEQGLPPENAMDAGADAPPIQEVQP